MNDKMLQKIDSRSSQRRQRDEDNLLARKEFGGKYHIPGEVSKIALNRMVMPKDEPPKWYIGGSLHPFRESAVRIAYEHLRKGEVQYAKVYKVGTEDGVMWGIKTYPKIIPWYVKEGLVEDEDRKKKIKKTKVKRKPVKRCRCK